MLRIQLIGDTTVVQGTHRLTGRDLGRPMPRRILQILALEPGTVRSKDVLAEWLWEGRPPASYVATLEAHLCVLRRTLGIARGRNGVLATTSRGYVLDADEVDVDVVAVRRLLTSGDVDAAATALDRISGDLLVEEPYAAWAQQARLDLDELVTRSCGAAAAQANRTGRHGLAVRLAEAAVRRGYFGESDWRELMLALWHTDGAARAVRVYQQLQRSLQTELGVDVSPETHRLYLQIVQGSPRERHATEEAQFLLNRLHTLLTSSPAVSLQSPTARELGKLLLARGPQLGARASA